MTMNKIRKYFVRMLLACIGISVFSASPALSQTPPMTDLQDVQQIVAIVNDEVISLYDLKQRARLLMLSTGRAQLTPEEGQFIQNQAMDALIDDRLKTQEADEYDAGLTMDQLNEAFTNYAAQFNLDADAFEDQLEASGVEKNTLLAQIEGSLAWDGIVNGLLQPLVNVTDDEVYNFIEKMERDKGKFQYRVNEIFILVTDNARREETLATANLMKQRLDEDVPFNAIAQQFSQSASASVGGDLGWLMLEEIPEDVRDYVPDLEIDAISDPIVTEEGIYIVSVTDRRRILTLDERDIRVSLNYLFFEQEEPTAETIAAFNQEMSQRLAGQDLCGDIEDIATSLNASESGTLDTLTIRELREDIAQEILPLEIGSTTPFMEDLGGLRAFVLCNKNVPEIISPDFETVLENMTQTRLQLLAKRHLRDLRRDAIVDYR